MSQNISQDFELDYLDLNFFAYIQDLCIEETENTNSQKVESQIMKSKQNSLNQNVSQFLNSQQINLRRNKQKIHQIKCAFKSSQLHQNKSSLRLYLGSRLNIIDQICNKVENHY